MSNRKKRKWIGNIAVFVLLTSVLAACGSSESKPDTNPSAPASASASSSAPTEAKGVTITVASAANWTKDIDKQLAEQFKAKTGNTIEFLLSPDDQYSNVLKAKFATGEGPDVYLTSGGVGVNEYLPDEHALDLSNEPWVSRYTDWAREGTTYKGKIIALNTWSVDGWGLIYNSEIFKQAGLQVPTTYEQFLEVCEALKASGITPIYEPGKAEWHQEIWLNTFGAMVAQKYQGIYDKLNANQAKLADLPELEVGLTQLKELADKGYYGEDFLSQTWENSVDAMGSGKFAMMLVYSTFQNEVLAKYPDSKADTWEMFPVPLAGNKAWATSAGGIVRSINKNSKVIDAAKEYFSFLAEPDNLKTYYAGRADLGPVSFKDVEGNTTNGYESIMKNAADGTGLDFEGGVQFWNQSTIGKLVQDLYLGGKTPKQVLEAIDDDRSKMF